MVAKAISVIATAARSGVAWRNIRTSFPQARKPLTIITRIDDHEGREMALQQLLDRSAELVQQAGKKEESRAARHQRQGDEQREIIFKQA